MKDVNNLVGCFLPTDLSADSFKPNIAPAGFTWLPLKLMQATANPLSDDLGCLWAEGKSDDGCFESETGRIIIIYETIKRFVMSAVPDYGPLQGLVGVWRGDKGLDVSPDPQGAEKNPYFETMTFSEVGNVTNAKTQVLAVLHYLQIVQRKSDGQAFHHQAGYWMWDAKAGLVIHSLIIPRSIAVIAGGQYQGHRIEDSGIALEVSAATDDQDWQIIQSPFMREHAKTLAFRQRVVIENDRLAYSETTTVEIYGKVFEHTDQNELFRLEK